MMKIQQLEKMQLKLAALWVSANQATDNLSSA